MIGDRVRRVRQNHGIEHATVAILLERGVRPPLGGYSTPGGFFIFSRASTEELADVAGQALHRLQAGTRELAVSPYCGTNLAVGALLAGMVSAVIMGRGEKRFQRIPAAALGIIVATLVSRPLGNALQRRYTTLAEVEDVEITGIRRLWGGAYTLHRISTRRRSSP